MSAYVFAELAELRLEMLLLTQVCDLNRNLRQNEVYLVQYILNAVVRQTYQS